MTLSIALLLGIIVVAMILFTSERISADIVALGTLMALTLTGLLPAEQAFAGFGSDAVIMIFGLLILTSALLRTGVVENTGRLIIRRVGERPATLLVVIMVASAALGAFVSNTASTAFFVPIVLGIARKTRVSASRFLLPLAFSSILSSSVTLVSTSTNIVVSNLMQHSGLPPMGMFELAPVGIPITIVGLVYMFVVGQRLIPGREEAGEANNNLAAHAYLTEVLIRPDSPLAGKTLAEAGLGRDMDLTVVRVVREQSRDLTPRANLRLHAGDVLLVEGQRDDVIKIKNTAGIDIKADVTLADPTLELGELRLVEAILLLRSPLIGRSLKSFRFRERYGLQVLAISRSGESLTHKVSQVRLRPGDILLVQGRQANVNALEEDGVFRVISSLEEKVHKLRHAPIAIGAFVGSLALATLKVVTLPVAVILGALAVFVSGAVTPEEAYREVEWKALILIGCMLGLGRALDYTGAAEYIAGVINQTFQGTSPLWLLTAFFAVTVLLTQPMSNQAAAVVIVPVALQTALQLGLNPRTFAMMIAVAASCSYLTPLEPSCLMVYGPGKYRFMDFVKVGSLLTVIIYLIAILLVPVVWPV